MTTSTKEFEKVLKSLEKALKEKKTDITRDATVQRFEFCVELAWKTAKKIMGSNSSAPKTLIREMAAEGLIDDPEVWFIYLNARNESSHTYKEDLAEKVYQIAQQFLPDGQDLLIKCQKK